MQLGKLDKIDDLRRVWHHEALDFTLWLAEDENLSLSDDREKAWHYAMLSSSFDITFNAYATVMASTVPICRSGTIIL